MLCTLNLCHAFEGCNENLNSVQEVEQLRQEKLEIDQKLRNMHTTNSVGSNQGYPPRRNDR